MILTYDADCKFWVFESNTSTYFYDEKTEHINRIRNLIAEFPEFIRDYIKNNSLDIEIREERTSMDISLKKIVCRWVKFEIFDTEGHKCGC